MLFVFRWVTNLPGFLPDPDFFAALWRLSLEAAAFVGSWGRRHRRRQGEVNLILGGEWRQEAHLAASHQTWKQEGKISKKVFVFFYYYLRDLIYNYFRDKNLFYSPVSRKQFNLFSCFFVFLLSRSVEGTNRTALLHSAFSVPSVTLPHTLIWN